MSRETRTFGCLNKYICETPGSPFVGSHSINTASTWHEHALFVVELVDWSETRVRGLHCLIEQSSSSEQVESSFVGESALRQQDCNSTEQ